MKRSINRRTFLNRMAAGAGACCATTLASKLSFTICPEAHAASNGKVLVAMYLNGGFDCCDWLRADIHTLNARRSTLNDILTTGLPVSGHGNLLWNPMLSAFKSENDAGNMAAINFVGMENLTGSHEVARNNWNYGRSNGVGSSQPNNGWLARLLNDLGAQSNFACFNLASLSLTQGTTAATKGSLGSFNFQLSGAEAERARASLYAIAAQQSAAPGQAELLLNSYANAEGSVDRVKAAISGTQFIVPYPDGPAGRALRDAERVIRNFPETVAIAIQRGGNDTHANQRNSNNNIMNDVNGAVSAFLANMRARGLGDKVTLLIYSEFGRQLNENSNAGTDHGRGGTVFAFGDAVNGGIYGPDYTPGAFSGPNRLAVEVNTVDVFGPVVSWMGANPNNIFTNYTPGLIPII